MLTVSSDMALLSVVEFLLGDDDEFASPVMSSFRHSGLWCALHLEQESTWWSPWCKIARSFEFRSLQSDHGSSLSFYRLVFFAPLLEPN